jgi:hypothetical protein
MQQFNMGIYTPAPAPDSGPEFAGVTGIETFYDLVIV